MSRIGNVGSKDGEFMSQKFACLHLLGNIGAIHKQIIPKPGLRNETGSGRGDYDLGNDGDEQGTSIKTKCRRKSVLRKHMGWREGDRETERGEEKGPTPTATDF